MNIIPIFPKVIYKSKISCLNDENVNYFKKIIDDDLIASPSNGFYTKNQFLLDEPCFKHIKEEILDYHIKQYVDQLGHLIEGVRISSSWGNVVQKNNSIVNHVHGNSYISGCFYLTNGSAIQLNNTEKINQQYTFSPNVKFDSNKPWTYETVAIDAHIGNILLFPSLLPHSVSLNAKNEKRYSIAFNTIPVGSFGGNTNKLTLC